MLSTFNAGYNNTSGNWANTPTNNIGFASPSGDPYVTLTTRAIIARCPSSRAA